MRAASGRLDTLPPPSRGGLLCPGLRLRVRSLLLSWPRLGREPQEPQESLCADIASQALPCRLTSLPFQVPAVYVCKLWDRPELSVLAAESALLARQHAHSSGAARAGDQGFDVAVVLRAGPDADVAHQREVSVLALLLRWREADGLRLLQALPLPLGTAHGCLARPGHRGLLVCGGRHVLTIDFRPPSSSPSTKPGHAQEAKAAAPADAAQAAGTQAADAEAKVARKPAVLEVLGGLGWLVSCGSLAAADGSSGSALESKLKQQTLALSRSGQGIWYCPSARGQTAVAAPHCGDDDGAGWRAPDERASLVHMALVHGPAPPSDLRASAERRALLAVVDRDGRCSLHHPHSLRLLVHLPESLRTVAVTSLGAGALGPAACAAAGSQGSGAVLCAASASGDIRLFQLAWPSNVAGAAAAPANSSGVERQLRQQQGRQRLEEARRLRQLRLRLQDDSASASKLVHLFLPDSLPGEESSVEQIEAQLAHPAPPSAAEPLQAPQVPQLALLEFRCWAPCGGVTAVHSVPGGGTMVRWVAPNATSRRSAVRAATGTAARGGKGAGVEEAGTAGTAGKPGHGMDADARLWLAGHRLDALAGPLEEHGYDKLGDFEHLSMQELLELGDKDRATRFLRARDAMDWAAAKAAKVGAVAASSAQPDCDAAAVAAAEMFGAPFVPGHAVDASSSRVGRAAEAEEAREAGEHMLEWELEAETPQLAVAIEIVVEGCWVDSPAEVEPSGSTDATRAGLNESVLRFDGYGAAHVRCELDSAADITAALSDLSHGHITMGALVWLDAALSPPVAGWSATAHSRPRPVLAKVSAGGHPECLMAVASDGRPFLQVWTNDDDGGAAGGAVASTPRAAATAGAHYGRAPRSEGSCEGETGAGANGEAPAVEARADFELSYCTWHHLAAVVTPDEAQLWVDGQQLACAPMPRRMRTEAPAASGHGPNAAGGAHSEGGAGGADGEEGKEQAEEVGRSAGPMGALLIGGDHQERAFVGAICDVQLMGAIATERGIAALFQGSDQHLICGRCHSPQESGPSLPASQEAPDDGGKEEKEGDQEQKAPDKQPQSDPIGLCAGTAIPSAAFCSAQVACSSPRDLRGTHSERQGVGVWWDRLPLPAAVAQASHCIGANLLKLDGSRPPLLLMAKRELELHRPATLLLDAPQLLDGFCLRLRVSQAREASGNAARDVARLVARDVCSVGGHGRSLRTAPLNADHLQPCGGLQPWVAMAATSSVTAPCSHVGPVHASARSPRRSSSQASLFACLAKPPWRLLARLGPTL